MFAILLALAWKSSLLLLSAWGVAALLSRRSAALRHAVWTASVAALLAMPFVQAFAPPLHAPIPFAPAPEAPAVRTAGTSAPNASAVSPLAIAPDPRPDHPVQPARREFDPRSIAIAVWLAGVAIALGYFAAGRVALAELARTARQTEDESWRALTKEVAAKFGVRRSIRLLIAPAAVSPMTWGSTILLPARAAEWPEAQRRAFLVHELAHIARRDCAIQEWAHVACALYWFQPLTWYAAWRLRVEREPACDDLVLHSGAGAEDYAQQLLEVVRGARAPRGALALSGAAMAAPSQLEARVRALLDRTRDRSRVGRRRGLVTAMAAVAILSPLAALAPEAARAVTPTGETLPKGDLARRWQQAQAEGAPGKDGAFWFAYAIDFDGGKDGGETLVSDSEGWDSKMFDGGSTKLADQLGCKDHDAVFLLRVPGKGKSFDRVAIRSGSLSPDLGRLPVVAIGKVGLEESFDWLESGLDEMPDDRRAVVLVTALSLHAIPRTVPKMVALLDGRRDDELRAQAAEGLSRHPGPPALAALKAHANKDKSIDVRREAAESLGDLGMPEATEVLIHLAIDADERLVRAEAVETLGACDPERVVGVLVSVADHDPEEMVRREAVETLGDLPGTDGLKALRHLLKSNDPAVRDEAAETLHDMGERAHKQKQ